MEVGGKTLKDTNAKNLLVFLKEAMQTFHGDYGLACVQHALNGNARRIFRACMYIVYTCPLSVKYLNVSTLVTILRCPRAHHRAVWSALTAITSYHGEPCTLTLLHLGGTIQSTQKALIRYNTVTLKKAMHCATSHSKLYN